MGDQLTTVAGFPTEFATIAGIIYAVIATPPKMRLHTCWSKINGLESMRVVHPAFSQEQTLEFRRDHQDPDLHRVCYAFARASTQKLRSFMRGGGKDGDVKESIAALHFLIWLGKSSSLHAPTRDDSPRASCQMNSSTSEAPHETNEIPSTSDGQRNSEYRARVTVNIMDYRQNSTSHEVMITPSKLLEWAKEALKNVSVDPEPLLRQLDLYGLIIAGFEKPFPKIIFAQRAAPWDVYIIEMGFKVIEMVFAIGTVLGSTGGAWLGLTLASIFPQRLAAGLYSSSFGQTLKQTEGDEAVDVHQRTIFIPPGTLWVNEDERYCVRPCLPWMSFTDSTRNMLGYIAQYSLLYVLTWFKLDVRTIVFASSYTHTKDAVRYVVLVIEPFVLYICWQRLKIKDYTWRGKAKIVLYFIMYAMGFICMVWAQKSFDVVIGITFYHIQLIADIIAAVGAIAAASCKEEHADSIFEPGLWGFIWAIGFFSVVW